MGTNNIDLPAGWRPLDLEILQKIAYLETKCISLTKQSENFVGMIKCLQAIVDSQERSIEHFQQESMRLDEVYYNVFPDRLAQDVQLQEQLEKIKKTASPDANTRGE